MGLLQASIEYSNAFYGFDLKCSPECYQNNPAAARGAAIPLAAVSGLIKPIIFPILAALAIILLPIRAGINTYQGKEDGPVIMGAWAFSVIGLAAYAAFFLISAHHLPAVASAGIVMAAISFSIGVHVYQASTAPAITQQANNL